MPQTWGASLQNLMQVLRLDAGTKGTAKALEEIQLLEERGAALAAEADEAEALHSSAGDPMTRSLHTPPPPRHIFMSHGRLHQTCDSERVLQYVNVACAQPLHGYLGPFGKTACHAAAGMRRLWAC